MDHVLGDIIRRALKEDIGRSDITSELLVPEHESIKAVLLAKESFLVCGLDIAKAVFREKDTRIKFIARVKDGERVKKGKILGHIWGPARTILTAERVALNLLSLLSGVATKTFEFVEQVLPYKVKIMDTRKTLPGLRALEKYAVRIGGGFNHRMRLDEMVLIKDNHLKVIGDRLWVMSFKKIKGKIKIEIEVKNLKEFKEALKLKPDIIMLDNMSIKDIKKAVQIKNALSTAHCSLSTELEASGGITLKNVRKIAATGVDMISVGELTDSVNSVDISLEVL